MTKILVVFTGGTICTSVNNGIINVDNTKTYHLIDKYKKMDYEVEFCTKEPYFILSENLSGEHLNKLCSCVNSSLKEKYDGIIVTLGTDTLQYCASAVSLTIKDCNIPIMFVSSNYPLSNENANGFDNFVNAIKFIKQKRGRGVFVSYKNQDETLKFHTPENLLDYDCFSDKLRSINDNFYGEYRKCGRFYNNINYKNINDNLSFNANFPDKSSVLRIKFHPGMTYPALEKIKCVIIEPYHSGTLKTDTKEFDDFINEAKKHKVKVILTGMKKGDVYSSVKDLKDDEYIDFSPYAPIYTYVKEWLIANR